MSLIINPPAVITVTLEGGRSITMTEEEFQCCWSFSQSGQTDIGKFINFLKFMAEMQRPAPEVR